ncbi:uncharacterized protein LOC121863107 [Homarus americanus]|uniref:uncharacterized protein LOC121863107 n=1 Tax=Homarus americanus TaxID=6706 RepID=UPI001C43D715|nr:uncharacterized protein LOC121863107 [Homarus americanus]
MSLSCLHQSPYWTRGHHPRLPVPHRHAGIWGPSTPVLRINGSPREHARGLRIYAKKDVPYQPLDVPLKADTTDVHAITITLKGTTKPPATSLHSTPDQPRPLQDYSRPTQTSQAKTKGPSPVVSQTTTYGALAEDQAAQLLY